MKTIIRENIFEILQLAGYTVYEAQNGKAGVDLAIKHKPEIILCDIMMPSNSPARPICENWIA